MEHLSIGVLAAHSPTVLVRLRTTLLDRPSIDGAPLNGVFHSQSSPIDRLPLNTRFFLPFSSAHFRPFLQNEANNHLLILIPTVAYLQLTQCRPPGAISATRKPTQSCVIPTAGRRWRRRAMGVFRSSAFRLTEMTATGSW